MRKIFISHSSADDRVVRKLTLALSDLGRDVWVDSRELRGGDPLWSQIERAIEEASGYIILVSKKSLQSKWLGRELRHALTVQRLRGKDQFPVVPLSLNGTKLGALEPFFDTEPLYIPVSSRGGGIEAALDGILTALGERVPIGYELQPKSEPVEELVLELVDLSFHEENGKRRVSAHASLVYEPATHDRSAITSVTWPFIAPTGPVEAEELRWYLEKYAIWPSEYFRDRARKVEENLVQWGRLLYEAALPEKYTSTVMKAWAGVETYAARRFSVLVDASSDAGARECATLLLGLPWELLHDGWRFVFQGAKPVLVRRRLPSHRAFHVPVVATPVRILLASPRPENEACGYIDHRASALPLIEAMEALGGLVSIHVLTPPTLPALRDELDRGRRDGEPYHVVHFDGHGVYDRHAGLGGLCFEHPQDIGRLEGRRHMTVYTSEFGPLLSEHQVPLLFLEACQTAQAEQASESVATEMLKVGMTSVVAMSHSVMVETARRFVKAFYASLARGARVGDAVLEGRIALKNDPFRGRVFGAGELRLQDWFVPVLFQEKDDAQLFLTTTTQQTREDLRVALAARFGELPREPQTGFVGRSRELLALQRLLRYERYALVRGQGGEGKTALAAELARWMVRSHQIRRAAFVSVETASTLAAVLDAIGRQLVPSYSVATFNDLEQAVLPVERALREEATLLVLDNMESILAPPSADTSVALSEEAHRELDAILTLCEQLTAKGDTRIVFTSREALPAPFNTERNRYELHQLNREDAVKLVERALNREADGAGAAADAARDAVEQLVETVHGHALTLALLVPSLRSRGIEATRASLEGLLDELQQKFPDQEKSLFTSLELSLRRMSPTHREHANVLGVFHGSINLNMLRLMMDWDEGEVAALADELIGVGLATRNPYGHLTLHPALCPFLREQLDPGERESWTVRWIDVMRQYVEFLQRLQSEKTEVAATLTLLELPNLFALLGQVESVGDPEATIDLATSLYTLLQRLGKPRLLERVAQTRDAAVALLGQTWNRARFQALRTLIEQQLDSGRLREAFAGAQDLLKRARAAGEGAYAGADYDLATGCLLLARVLNAAGGAEQALPLLEEAQHRFEVVQHENPDRGAEGMASVCIAERGDALLDLGRLEEAADAYVENIRRAESSGNERSAAIGRSQLGNVRMAQHRYREALEAYADARERFTRLDEPGSVATVWHQTGMVYQEAGQAEAAEDAYRKALAIKVRLGDVAAQASTLSQLGILYDNALGRPDEAIAFYRQAVDKSVECGDVMREGARRNNLAVTLLKLSLLEEARQEIRRAIQCKEGFGHASQPWTSWAILADIEKADGHSEVAAEARHKAIGLYLAYRRDGGENHNVSGRICVALAQLLRVDDVQSAASLVQQIAADADLPGWLRPFVEALQEIVAGSRERTLADHLELHYTMAAEILFLIETLESSKSVAH